MEKRKFERMPVNILVKYYCGDDEYSGTVTNISENGMFIRTDSIGFPFDSEFTTILPVEKQVFNIPVQVRRIQKTGDRYDGIGVELLNPPHEYLNYVSGLRTNL